MVRSYKGQAYTSSHKKECAVLFAGPLSYSEIDEEKRENFWVDSSRGPGSVTMSMNTKALLQWSSKSCQHTHKKKPTLCCFIEVQMINKHFTTEVQNNLSSVRVLAELIQTHTSLLIKFQYFSQISSSDGCRIMFIAKNFSISTLLQQL